MHFLSIDGDGIDVLVPLLLHLTHCILGPYPGLRLMLATPEAISTFPIHCGGDQDSSFGVEKNSRSPVSIVLRVTAYCEVQYIVIFVILSRCVARWFHLREEGLHHP